MHPARKQLTAPQMYYCHGQRGGSKRFEENYQHAFSDRSESVNLLDRPRCPVCERLISVCDCDNTSVWEFNFPDEQRVNYHERLLAQCKVVE
jgi:hypothetical protein